MSANKRKLRKYIKKRNPRKYLRINLIIGLILGGIGIFLIIDGSFSILLQWNEPLESQLVRIIRSGVGIFITLLGIVISRYKLIKNDKTTF